MADETANVGILEKIKKLREEIVGLQKEEKTLTADESNNLYKLETQLSKLVAIQEKRIKRSFGSKAAELDIASAFSTQRSELNEISKVYAKLTDFQKSNLSAVQNTNKSVQKSLVSDDNKKEIYSTVLESVSELQKLQQKLAESGPEDLQNQESIRDAYNSQINKIKQTISAKESLYEIIEKEAKFLNTIVESQAKGLKIAEQYSIVSKEQKELAEDQIEAYKTMQNTLRGTLNTLQMTLRTPEAMIVAASTAAGKFASAMSDVNRETGMFIGSTTLLSFAFDDASSTLTTMAKLSGNVESATFGAQLNTNVLAKSLGIGGDEAATLVNSFGNLTGASQDIGENMLSTLGNTARLNGVLPKQVASDIAGSMEEMALYSKDTGQNFADAAIQAAKLGVSVGTTTNIADNLLDFENSITKELEAGALLGRRINLDRARALAYEEDMVGMTKAVLAEVGGIDGFNKMDVFQKRAVAEALGISVGELKSMVANQENLNTTTGQIQQTWGMVNDYLRAAGDMFGGPIASGATFFLGELIKAKLTAAAIKGEGLGGMVKSLFGGGTGAPSAAGPLTKAGKPDMRFGANKMKDTIPSTDNAGKTSDGMNKLGKINGVALLQAAGAMLVMAGAIYVTAKAFQEFDKVKNVSDTLLMFGATLGGFTASLMLLSLVATPLAPILAPLAVVFLAFGGAIMLAGLGMKFFGEGISSIVGVLPSVVDPLSKLSQINFMPILGLAAALGILSVALAAVATSGGFALPILAGLGLVSVGAEMLFGGGGDGNVDKTDMLIEEIKGLRADLNSGKIAVYMDGKKVTSGVAKVVNTTSTNSYVPK
jgi:hypothetical protein